MSLGVGEHAPAGKRGRAGRTCGGGQRQRRPCEGEASACNLECAFHGPWPTGHDMARAACTAHGVHVRRPRTPGRRHAGATAAGRRDSQKPTTHLAVRRFKPGIPIGMGGGGRADSMLWRPAGPARRHRQSKASPAPPDGSMPPPLLSVAHCPAGCWEGHTNPPLTIVRPQSSSWPQGSHVVTGAHTLQFIRPYLRREPPRAKERVVLRALHANAERDGGQQGWRRRPAHRRRHISIKMHSPWHAFRRIHNQPSWQLVSQTHAQDVCECVCEWSKQLA